MGEVTALSRLPGAGLFTDMGEDVAVTMLRAMLQMFTDAFGARIRDILTEMFAASQRPPVTAATFISGDGPYHTVASVSTGLLAVALVIGVIQGLLSGQPGQAFARLGIQLPIAVLAIGGFPWLADQMLTLGDVLADAVLPPDKTTRLVEVISTPPSDDFPGLLATLLAFLGAVLLAMELVVRDALVLIIVALAPLSFAASVIPAARPAGGQVVRLVGAAVLAKPSIYVALRIGVDQLDEPYQAGAEPSSWRAYILALAVAVVAVFMPAVVWRLIPLAEAFTLAQGISRAPFRGAQQTAQLAYWGRALGGGLGAAFGSVLGVRRGGQAGRGLPGGAPRPAGERDRFQANAPRQLPDPSSDPTSRRRRPDPPAGGDSLRPAPDPPAPPPGAGPGTAARRRQPRRRRPDPGGAADPGGGGR
ncbi:hypothetical protein I6A84_22570 [Frankia sp. CNm7]|uniref:Uncharacterized protein n=1 Tax=Frankia nepalensis TaxID=1836974 RepID=A0A937RDK5_9ACTN|nr:hypothetical protein [Frankia nepalensis]MBL7498300.1 hypothetical protein [Frankia nepalensis]MBL7509108.1 hypothetical protein [Frankia nepalensis]MBL7520795.1 hypothetical protein [Frankia nepalensis]MBL7630153.1 hypothetical protein [Frankia nepalensis]